MDRDQAAGRRGWTAGEVVRRGTTFASFAVIARFLGVADFATFALITAGFSIAFTVVQSAMDRLLVRTWIENPAGARALARLSATVVAGLTAIATIICATGGATLAASVGLYGLSVALQVAVWGEETNARAAGDLPRSNRLKSIAEILPSVARAAGAIAGGTLLWTMAMSAIAAAGVAWLGRSNLLPPSASVLRQSGLRAALVSAGVGLGTAVYFRMDLFLISWLASDSAVAGYAIATKLLEVTLLVPSVYGQLSIAEFVESDRAAASAWRRGLRLTRFGCVLSALLAILAVPVAALAELVLDKDLPAELLALLALTIPAAYYGAVLGNVAFARHRETALLVVLAVMVVLNGALNLVAIPAYGAPGAAAITVVTEVIGVLLLSVLMREETRDLRLRVVTS